MNLIHTSYLISVVYFIYFYLMLRLRGIRSLFYFHNVSKLTKVGEIKVEMIAHHLEGLWYKACVTSVRCRITYEWSNRRLLCGNKRSSSCLLSHYSIQYVCEKSSLFCAMTNKWTITSQIKILLHVSTLSYHLQGACNVMLRFQLL